MSLLEIRPATAADLPFVTEIYQHAVLYGTATFELIPPDLAEMTQRFDVLVDGGFPYFVAVLEGRVVGYAYAGAYRPRPAYRFTVENSVYLEPAIQRRGIGLQLLRRRITESEGRGYRQMIAVIGDSANAGSIGVHTQCGFQMIGTHPDVGFKFGRWLDTVMMQLALGEGATTLPAEPSLWNLMVGRCSCAVYNHEALMHAHPSRRGQRVRSKRGPMINSDAAPRDKGL